MTRVAIPIRTGDVVVDTSTKLTASECLALRRAGVDAVWRYVYFGLPRPGDLDAGELELMLAAQLTVLVVQHVRNPGWVASAATGLADAKAAIANAQAAGYASAGAVLSLGLDMEGVRNPGPDCVAHANAWCSAVRDAGYGPVVYCGYDSGLSGQPIDGQPQWWADYAPISQRPPYPYALHQKPQSTIAGIGVDVDDVLVNGAIVGLSEETAYYAKQFCETDPDLAAGPTSEPHS